MVHLGDLLYEQAEANDAEAFKSLLGSRDINDPLPFFGHDEKHPKISLLQRSVALYDDKVASFLLAHGGNVNEFSIKATDSTDDAKTSLFEMVLQYHSLGLIKIFLNHGANINGLSSQGAPLIFTVLERSNAEIINTAIDYGANVDITHSNQKIGQVRTCLFHAAISLIPNNELKTFKRIVSKTSNANEVSFDLDAKMKGIVPLSIAADFKSFKAVDISIKAGANRTYFDPIEQGMVTIKSEIIDAYLKSKATIKQVSASTKRRKVSGL